MRCVLGEPRDGITIEAEVTNLRFANDTTRTGVVHKQGRVAGLAETCPKTMQYLLKRQMQVKERGFHVRWKLERKQEKWIVFFHLGSLINN